MSKSIINILKSCVKSKATPCTFSELVFKKKLYYSVIYIYI